MFEVSFLYSLLQIHLSLLAVTMSEEFVGTVWLSKESR